MGVQFSNQLKRAHTHNSHVLTYGKHSNVTTNVLGCCWHSMTYYLRAWKGAISQWRCLSWSCLRYEVRSWLVSLFEGSSCFSIDVHGQGTVQRQENRWPNKNFARRFKQRRYNHLVKFYKNCPNCCPSLWNSPPKFNDLNRQRATMRILEMAQRQNLVNWSKFPWTYH